VTGADKVLARLAGEVRRRRRWATVRYFTAAALAAILAGVVPLWALNATDAHGLWWLATGAGNVLLHQWLAPRMNEWTGLAAAEREVRGW
jgi:hypothetical protein